MFVAISSSLEDRCTGNVWGVRLVCRVWGTRKPVSFKHHSYSGIVQQKSTFSLDADRFYRQHRAIGITKFIKLPSGLTGSRNMPLVMAACSHFTVYLKAGLGEDCRGCKLHLKFQCFERGMGSFQSLLWDASLFCTFAILICHRAWFRWEERQPCGSVKFYHSTAHPTGLTIAAPLPVVWPFCKLTARGWGGSSMQLTVE